MSHWVEIFTTFFIILRKPFVPVIKIDLGTPKYNTKAVFDCSYYVRMTKDYTCCVIFGMTNLCDKAQTAVLWC